MRWVVVVALAGLAGCAANAPAPSGNFQSAGPAASQTPSAFPLRAERDALVRQEAMLAARNGQPLQPIIQRHAEENVRDGVAPTPLGRHSPARVLHFERVRLFDVATHAVTSMNDRARAANASAIEQGRRQSYCRSLAADIDIAGSNTAEITLRVLGMGSPRENSLYLSCMASFGRTDAYLGR